MTVVPDNSQGIRELGHRAFVGGDGDLWERIGQLQFRFLVGRGLRPEHVLLDFACGSLRGGLHFIPYLQPGNYVGFDKSVDLVILGVAQELGLERFRAMRPQFVINGRFDLSELPARPDFVIAQSILTHLTPADIVKALAAIATVAKPSTELYATYFRRDHAVPNPEQSHSRLVFWYTPEEMASFGAGHGWRFEDLGDWEHPRGQQMGLFRRA
jgi:SAM-dependent methyltransferase